MSTFEHNNPLLIGRQNIKPIPFSKFNQSSQTLQKPNSTIYELGNVYRNKNTNTSQTSPKWSLGNYGRYAINSMTGSKWRESAQAKRSSANAILNNELKAVPNSNRERHRRQAGLTKTANKLKRQRLVENPNLLGKTQQIVEAQKNFNNKIKNSAYILKLQQKTGMPDIGIILEKYNDFELDDKETFRNILLQLQFEAFTTEKENANAKKIISEIIKKYLPNLTDSKFSTATGNNLYETKTQSTSSIKSSNNNYNNNSNIIKLFIRALQNAVKNQEEIPQTKINKLIELVVPTLYNSNNRTNNENNRTNNENIRLFKKSVINYLKLDPNLEIQEANNKLKRIKRIIANINSKSGNNK